MPKKLTEDELTTLVSRFRNSMHRLKQSGDYPEEESDNQILYKLISMKYNVSREVNKDAETKT